VHRVIRHIPNFLTLARLAALPVIVIVYGRDVPGPSWTTAVIILAAALSDVIDGLIARQFDVRSEFGRWLDPIVDRAFFFTIVAMLWYYGTLPLLAVLPILLRDGIILVLALPVKRFTSAGPAVSAWGRAANFVLVLGLQFFIVDLRLLGWFFYGIGLVLYVGSAFLYLYRGLRFYLVERAAEEG
jgi:CDP-diacylglycerol--glycerol-3-phosphate 3-phosphatidyltransferase